MKRVALSLGVSLLFTVLWSESAMAVAYCPPEYQSCEGSGTPGGTWGGSSTGQRDGYKEYGARYDSCRVLFSPGRCWECVFNPTRQTEVCGGVRHDGSCGCGERYSNYIVVECQNYGLCLYDV